MIYPQYNPYTQDSGNIAEKGRKDLSKGPARTSVVRWYLLGQVQMGKVKQLVQSLTFCN